MNKSGISFFALLLAVLIRIFFVFQLPDTNTVDRRLEGLNDEPSHYNYVWFLAANNKLPVQTMSVQDSEAFEINEFEYYQPPLYYLTASIGAKVMGHTGGRIVARLLSFIFGILTCVVIYRIALQCKFSDDDAVLTAAFVGLLPAHAYFSSVVSNDSLSWLIAAASVYTLFAHRAARKSQVRWITAISTGVLLGLGMLTKSSLLIMPVFAVGVFAVTLFQKEGKIATVSQALVALVISAALAAPWYLRNIEVYGSFLPIEVGFGPASPWISSVTDVARFLWGSSNTFWFPMQHLSASPILKAIRAFDAVLIGAHVGIALYGLFTRKRPALMYLLLFLMALSLAAFVRLNISWWESEGRFLFSALPAIAIFFVFSARRIIPQKPDDVPFAAYVLFIGFHPYLYLAFA